MRLQRCNYKGREYILLRRRDEPDLQPHQVGIELVDVKNFETLVVPLSAEPELELLPQLPTTRMWTDMYPLEPNDLLPFTKRDQSMLFELQARRQALQRTARTINKSRKTTQDLIDEANGGGTATKTRKPRTPKDPNAPKTPRKPRATKPKALPVADLEAMMRAKLGLQ